MRLEKRVGAGVRSESGLAADCCCGACGALQQRLDMSARAIELQRGSRADQADRELDFAVPVPHWRGHRRVACHVRAKNRRILLAMKFLPRFSAEVVRG